jgi:hypothetical protein
VSAPDDVTGAPSGAGAARARQIASIRTSGVVIRGCSRCRTPRPQPEAPCPACGLEQAAQVDDLGQLSASYADPLLQAEWERTGKPAAAARVQDANRRNQ